MAEIDWKNKTAQEIKNLVRGLNGIMGAYTIINDKKYKLLKVQVIDNQEFLNNLLREKMQFKGYINTDSGVIDFISWGEENKTNSEKVAKAINSGVDLISDTNHVEWVIEAVKQGLLTEEKVNEAVERVAIEMFEQGLFENPYVEAEKAKDIVATQENIDKAYEVHQ